MKTEKMNLEIKGQGFNITAIPWKTDELRVTVRSEGVSETYDYDIPARKLERNKVRMTKMVSNSMPTFTQVETLITNKLLEWTVSAMA